MWTRAKGLSNLRKGTVVPSFLFGTRLARLTNVCHSLTAHFDLSKKHKSMFNRNFSRSTCTFAYCDIWATQENLTVTGTSRYIITATNVHIYSNWINASPPLQPIRRTITSVSCEDQPWLTLCKIQQHLCEIAIRPCKPRPCIIRCIVD
jgi:hypothetical protein